MFVGFGIRSGIKIIGTENLLYVIAAALAVSLMMVMRLGKVAGTELTAAKERTPSRR